MKVRLRDVVTFQHGGTPSRSDSSLWGMEVPWVSPKDMKSFEISESQESLSLKGADSAASSLVSPGSLLVVIRSGILKHTLPVGVVKCRVAFNQDIKALVPDERVLDATYLAFCLRSREQSILKDGVKVGPTVHSIKSGALESLDIPLPDLPVQRRIASRLKGQMAAVEEARKTVEEQQQSVAPLFEKLLADAFEGIIPLSLGINSDPAPLGWEWHRLLDLARLESGHTPSRKHPEYWENGHIPWLALPDIRALDCQIAMETSEKTNDLGIANSSARLLPADTVALSRTASVGFVTLFGRPMATSQDFVNWICGKEIHPKFLMWLMRASRKFIREVSTGAIHKTVYMDVVERFHVCLPSLPAQQAITARLDAAFEQTEALRVGLEDQMEAVAALPAAYLRAAFEETE